MGFGNSYSYDGFGNMLGTSVTKAGGITTSTPVVAATNRLLGVSYDANGNQLGDVYTTNVWDVENRMIAQLNGSGPGGTAYSYDPGGHRVLKNWNSDPTG